MRGKHRITGTQGIGAISLILMIAFMATVAEENKSTSASVTAGATEATTVKMSEVEIIQEEPETVEQSEIAPVQEEVIENPGSSTEESGNDTEEPIQSSSIEESTPGSSIEESTQGSSTEESTEGKKGNAIKVRATFFTDSDTCTGKPHYGTIAGRRQDLGKTVELYSTDWQYLGEYTFEDVGYGPKGGIVNGTCIDIWFPSDEEGWEFERDYGDYVYMIGR